MNDDIRALGQGLAVEWREEDVIHENEGTSGAGADDACDERYILVFVDDSTQIVFVFCLIALLILSYSPAPFLSSKVTSIPKAGLVTWVMYHCVPP